MAMYVLLNAQIALSLHIYCIGKTLFHMCNNVFFNGSNGTKVKISACDNMGEFDALCSELIPSALVKEPGNTNRALPFLLCPARPLQGLPEWTCHCDRGAADVGLV